jgi:rSAM/selenodomain-associated transferase 2
VLARLSPPNAEPSPVLISIIIPTLDEAKALGATLDAVARLSSPIEVLIVDGGSRDATLCLAREHSVRVVQSPRGRGPQLRRGAEAARGEVLWFLHADTLPAPDAAERIRAVLRQPHVVGGNCRIRFAGHTAAARFMTWLYPHLGRFGLCYGDSAIFVRRADYEGIRGFPALPLFEDLELVSRLRRRGRFRRQAAEVTTSARRFEDRAFIITLLRWVGLQLLYWLGISPHLLARRYAPIRGEPGVSTPG